MLDCGQRMQVWVISGKGGVGKSSVALALSFYLAQSKKEHLLVEMGAWPFLAHLWSLSYPYQPQKLQPYQWYQAWNESELLKEYVRFFIPWGQVDRWFVENPLTQAFLKSAVGLKELILSGKLTAPFRGLEKKTRWDLWVVDAFSSGHFLNILKTPKAIVQKFKRGPILTQSQSILDVFRSGFIRVLWVTQSDDLSVQETLEQVPQIQDLGIPVYLLCNGWVQPDLTIEHPELLAWAQYQKEQKNRLTQLKTPLWELPWEPRKRFDERAQALSTLDLWSEILQ